MDETSELHLFTNPSVELSQLPTVDTQAWESLAPSYYQLNMVRAAISSFFYLVLFVGFLLINGLYLFSLGWIIVLLVWGLLTFFQFWMAARRFAAEAYSLRSRDILHRKGILIQTETIIPFNRVQHVSLQRGPLEKFYGLASLKVFTAGGQSSDLEISGLEAARANQLKDYIAAKTGEDGIE